MIDVSKIDKYLLINDDCFSTLKTLPDNSIDLILTDPPYNIAKYSTGNMKFDWRSEINNDLAEWDLTELRPQDLVESSKEFLNLMEIYLYFVPIILSANITRFLIQNLIPFNLWYGIKRILYLTLENHHF